MSGIEPNYIDTFVVKRGSQYHAFTKNESAKYVEHALATSLAGPWRFVQTGKSMYLGDGWGSWADMVGYRELCGLGTC